MGTPKFNPPTEISWWVGVILCILSLLFFITNAIWVTVFEKGDIGSFPYFLMAISAIWMLVATKVKGL